MRELSRYVVSLIAAGGLVAGVLTTAFAGHSAPRAAQGRNVTVTGNLQVNGVIKGNSNGNIKKNFYVRGKSEIYQGLLLRNAGLTVNKGGVTVKAGGVTTDTLTDSGQAQLGSLGVTGAETVGGTLVTTGLLTANAGVNAGSGGLTTTGNVTAGAGTFSSLTDTGSLVAAGLAVTGNVDFTHATVSGLSLSNIVGTGNLTLQSLALGSPTANTPPLTLAANGKTASISVGSAGDVQLPSVTTAGDATIGGNLTVAGSTGVITSTLTSPLSTGTNPTLTALAIKGSTITLTGATTIAGNLSENGTTALNGAATVNGNNDLTLAGTTGTGATASHLIGNGDVAGTVSVNVPSTAQTSTPSEIDQTYTFARPFTKSPEVLLTAASDPDHGYAVPPKVWVTENSSSSASGTIYPSFTVHYLLPPTPPATPADFVVTYNYHVIG